MTRIQRNRGPLVVQQDNYSKSGNARTFHTWRGLHQLFWKLTMQQNKCWKKMKQQQLFFVNKGFKVDPMKETVENSQWTVAFCYFLRWQMVNNLGFWAAQVCLASPIQDQSWILSSNVLTPIQSVPSPIQDQCTTEDNFGTGSDPWIVHDPLILML